MEEKSWLASKDPIAMLDWLYQHHTPSDRKLRLVACACCRRVGHLIDELSMPWLEKAEESADSGERLDDQDPPSFAVTPIGNDETSSAGVVGAIVWFASWGRIREAVRTLFSPAACGVRQILQPADMCDTLRDIIGNPFRPVTVEERHPSRWPGREYVYRPAWLTPLVLQLAEAAYTVRTGTGTLDNDALAVLSDALEDAGLPERVPFLTCNGTGKHSHNGRAGEVIHGILHDCDPRKAHHHHDEKCQILLKPNPILAHLRDPGPHYRGCWALDLLLGKE